MARRARNLLLGDQFEGVLVDNGLRAGFTAIGGVRADCEDRLVMLCTAVDGPVRGVRKLDDCILRELRDCTAWTRLAPRFAGCGLLLVLLLLVTCCWTTRVLRHDAVGDESAVNLEHPFFSVPSARQDSFRDVV